MAFYLTGDFINVIEMYGERGEWTGIGMMKALNIKIALIKKYNFLVESMLAYSAFPFASIFLSS